MRCLYLLLLAVAAAWSSVDLEIFRLRDSIVRDLGEDVTFYSWLGVKPGASSVEVNKAFRKVSRALHPDRNPGTAATERFQRLNAVHKILRSPDRERYDFYLSKGFPLQVTEDDYVFRRFRPSLMVAFLLIGAFATLVQYVTLKMSAKRKRDFIQGIIDEARQEARSRHGGVQTADKNVEVNGKHFLVEVTGAVTLVDSNAGRLLVTVDDVPEPTLWDTLPGKLLRRLFPIAGPKTPAATSVVKKSNSEKHVTEGSVGSPSQPALKVGASRRRPAGNHHRK